MTLSSMLLLVLLSQPAVLLDPLGARERARTLEGQPLEAAEAFLLSGDATSALSIARDAPPGPRRLRLEADAYVALHDPRASEALAALEAEPGWEQHALWGLGSVEREETRASVARVGTILFALCLGLLLLGAGKELVRPGQDGVVVAVALAVSVGILSQLSKPLMMIMGVVGIGGLALAHAGTAMIRRSAAGPRGRIIVATVVLLGFAGAAFGVAYRVGLLPAVAPLL